MKTENCVLGHQGGQRRVHDVYTVTAAVGKKTHLGAKRCTSNSEEIEHVALSTVQLLCAWLKALGCKLVKNSELYLKLTFWNGLMSL